jgi:hypothetical protein
MPDEELFEKGLKTRRQVLGAKYVDANLAGSDDFMMTFQRAVTEGQSGSARNVLKTSLVTHCCVGDPVFLRCGIPIRSARPRSAGSMSAHRGQAAWRSSY